MYLRVNEVSSLVYGKHGSSIALAVGSESTSRANLTFILLLESINICLLLRRLFSCLATAAT